MKDAHWKMLVGVMMVCALFTNGAQADDNSRLGRLLKDQLEGAAANEQIPVIVRMRGQVEVQGLTTVSRKPGQLRRQQRAALVRTLKAKSELNRRFLQPVLIRHGIQQARHLWLINGVALTASPALIEELSRLPEVASIQVDRQIRLPAVATAEVPAPAEPNIDLIKAPDLWALGYSGYGVTVAILDSGVDIDHPDLGPRWRGGENSWYDPNGEHPVVPTDPDGHGTLAAGIVLGGDSGGTTIGVAPGAQWIGVKIFDDAGAASNSSIHAAFQWLLDPDGNPETDDAPDIVNNSWGYEAESDICDQFTLQFQTDVQALKAAGIAVVFSAGNQGPAQPSSVAPANYPESFAVGSVGTFDSATDISDFSSRGPSACDDTIYPELVAPGYAVKSSYPSDPESGQPAYLWVSGSSFSVPHVSGAMALLLEAFPGTSIAALETALTRSATDLGLAGADNSYGFGLVDLLAAYNALGGQSGISVTDSISPQTDGLVDFGAVPPDVVASASVHVRNTGSLPLRLGDIDDSNLKPPFSVTDDGCSGQLLEVGESCVVALQFAPLELGEFTGRLEILADSSGLERVTVALNGAGNTPPVPPQALSPADGAEVTSRVTFRWLPASDADGDAVSQFLVYSAHEEFFAAETIEVGTIPAALLGSGGLLLGALLAGLVHRRRRGTALVILAVVVLALSACGGGGGGGDRELSSAQSTTVDGLTSGVTYYWKMVARDSRGAESESAVRTFDVQ